MDELQDRFGTVLHSPAAFRTEVWRRLLTASVLIAFSACTSNAPISAEKSSQEIVGGVASANTSVVMHRTPAGQFRCSATVVSNSIVTTALHCLAGQRANQLNYWSGPTGLNFQGTGRVAFFNRFIDFAVVVLDRNTTVPAMPVRLVPLGPGDLCRVVQLVGYGAQGPAGPAGTRMEGPARIVAIRPVEFDTFRVGFTPAGVPVAGGCPGDSGGAAILFGRLTGVMVRANCWGFTISTRVDVMAGLIRQAIRWRNLNPPGGGGGALGMIEGGGDITSTEGDSEIGEEEPTDYSDDLTDVDLGITPEDAMTTAEAPKTDACEIEHTDAGVVETN